MTTQGLIVSICIDSSTLRHEIEELQAVACVDVMQEDELVREIIDSLKVYDTSYRAEDGSLQLVMTPMLEPSQMRHFKARLRGETV